MFDVRFQDISPAFLPCGEVTLEHYRQIHIDEVVNWMLEKIGEQGNRISSADPGDSRGACDTCWKNKDLKAEGAEPH